MQWPNPSIERTSSGRLCLPTAAAHVERWAPGVEMKLTIQLFFLIALLGYGTTSTGEDNSPREPVFLRPATPAELVGIWSVQATAGSPPGNRFVAITADGRIGWVVGSEAGASAPSSILGALDRQALSVSSSPNTGWHRIDVRDGSITQAAADGEVEQYFRAYLATPTPTGGSGWRANRGVVPGDLVLQQTYRLRPPSSPATLPPHQMSPLPVHLRRVSD
jgi:hypothetical protein